MLARSLQMQIFQTESSAPLSLHIHLIFFVLAYLNGFHPTPPLPLFCARAYRDVTLAPPVTRSGSSTRKNFSPTKKTTSTTLNTKSVAGFSSSTTSPS
mmetsp:Transcript_39818/g.95819  ORF Transcript_39818/g.95819 Transcript_39818/m.95819 type:complete len:98 (-) Transcript_39818:1180-1473(-)